MSLGFGGAAIERVGKGSREFGLEIALFAAAAESGSAGIGMGIGAGIGIGSALGSGIGGRCWRAERGESRLVAVAILAEDGPAEGAAGRRAVESVLWD